MPERTSLEMSAALRDVFSSLALKAVKVINPPPRIGSVQKIDRVNNIAYVQFPGDDGALPVKITPGIQPRYAAFDTEDGKSKADTVRVGGKPGAYYLMDVITSSAVNNQYEADIKQVKQDVTAVVPTTAPALTPPIEVQAGATQFVVKCNGTVAQSTKLQYHISTTPDFIPSSATMYVETSSTIVLIMSLPNTSPLVLDQPYYIKVVAVNAVGAAAPSASPLVTLNKNALDSLIFGSIAVGFILTGKITIGQITIDANEGIVIPQSTGGTTRLRADGKGNSFAGDGSFDVLAVQRVLSLMGKQTLNAGVADPVQAPQVRYDYVARPLQQLADASYRVTLVDHPLDNGAWLTGEMVGNVFRLIKLNRGNGIASQHFTVNFASDRRVTSVAADANYVYLQVQATTFTYVIRYLWDGSFAQYSSTDTTPGYNNGQGFPAVIKVANGNLMTLVPTASGLRARILRTSDMQSQVTYTIDPNWAIGSHVVGGFVGDYNNTGERLYVAGSNSVFAYSKNDDTDYNGSKAYGVRAASEDFPLAVAAFGFTYSAQLARPITAGGAFCYEHTALNPGGYLRVGYTWARYENGALVAETKLSEIRTETSFRKYSRYNIDFPTAIPAGATHYRVYIKTFNDSNPWLFQGVVLANTVAYATFSNTAQNPPAASNFNSVLGETANLESAAFAVGSTTQKAIDLKGTGHHFHDYTKDLGFSGWKTPVFQNGWTDYNQADQWAKAEYCLLNGEVIVRGLVAGGNAINAVVFNLPVGYRPPRSLIFAAAVSGVGYNGNTADLDRNTYAQNTGSAHIHATKVGLVPFSVNMGNMAVRLDVQSDGNVVFQAPMTNTQYASLSCIRFLVY